MCWFKIADAVCFLADCAIQPDLHVIRSYSQYKSHNFFGTSSGYGKVKKTRQFLTPKTTKGMRYRILYAGWLRQSRNNTVLFFLILHFQIYCSEHEHLGQPLHIAACMQRNRDFNHNYLCMLKYCTAWSHRGSMLGIMKKLDWNTSHISASLTDPKREKLHWGIWSGERQAKAVVLFHWSRLGFLQICSAKRQWLPTGKIHIYKRTVSWHSL